MSWVIHFSDIALCTFAVSIGVYYLIKNRSNGSSMRTLMVLLIGALALDTLFSVYILVSNDQPRSLTILAVHAAITGILYVLAYRPEKCEYPAMHHLGHVSRCVAVKKTTIASQIVHTTTKKVAS